MDSERRRLLRLVPGLKSYVLGRPKIDPTEPVLSRQPGGGVGSAEPYLFASSAVSSCRIAQRPSSCVPAGLWRDHDVKFEHHGEKHAISATKENPDTNAGTANPLPPKDLGKCRYLSEYSVADLHLDNSKKPNFDFIVVGGGTAGSVVANRLTENSNHSVLVLEAGGIDTGVLNIEAPFFSLFATPNTPQDWNFTTTPQPGLNNRAVPYPRGFILGGTSAVNYLVYTRGTKEDFNRFARIANDDRWSWDSLTPYMHKTERFTEPVDHHNTTGWFNPAVHGFNGPNSVTLNNFPTEIDGRVFNTTQQDPEFPFNLDMNSGSHLGLGWTQLTAFNGSRSSAATSYLATNIIARPNLKILLHARVTRILPSAIHDFRTVEFQDAQGKTHLLTAGKELILSAGSVNTPSILLHSGIGNSTTLSALGIKPQHNLPSVGQNLTDHALLSLGWSVQTESPDGTFDPIVQNATARAAAIAQWQTTKTGRLVNDVLSQIAWLRVPDNSSIFERFADPSAGPNTAHYELLFSNGFTGAPPAPGNYFGIVMAVVSPSSRGSVTINSTDPLAPPLINPNILGTELDMFFMRYAVRSAFRFAATQPFANYITALPAGLTGNESDDELDVYIQNKSGTVFHPVSTASVSPVGAEYGVVDPDLKVKGLKGLRIVDVSVMPLIPAAHTQAAAYIIGERAADMIKESW
ncbi:Alcohol oxidase [Mycena indigotica]|uniref:Alcohol oxidase n=1 Tax=Mycena indigotica TaxID=2126181 RepID=A0A8H6TDZ2_9AGAR|nr:Alcohol oxidase [Mycena indigotica]KAF7315923.1 Alcohol oxidase [Mycena indigotica]